jgi:5-methyltetrahydropteroyltriglutamate--homocysteine methyltransferase
MGPRRRASMLWEFTLVPLDTLAIIQQAGSASIAAGNLVSCDDQRRQLEPVVEVARNVWD